MSESKARISPDRRPTSLNGRRFSDDFKCDAVRLVVDEGYTFKAAAKAEEALDAATWGRITWPCSSFSSATAASCGANGPSG